MIFERVSNRQPRPDKFIKIYSISTSPKNIASLLNQQYPTPSHLSHLKKVHKSNATNRLLITAIEEITIEELNAWFTENWHEEFKIYVDDVVAYAPLDEDEWERWKGGWGVTYKGGQKKIETEMTFDVEEYWDQLIKESELSPTKKACIITSSTAILTSTHDTRHTHPLHHPIMTAINNISIQEKQSRKRKIGSLGYLCKDMDVYVNYEPCVMCCMALVHSRIGRLFFMRSKTDEGGVTVGVHDCEGINHHYEVWCLKSG